MTTTTLSPRELKRRRKQGADYVPPSPYTVKAALTKGDIFTKLSAIVFGLGNIVRKQYVKGLLLLAGEVGFIAFFVTNGFKYLSKLPSIGDQETKRVKNASGLWVTTAGDASVLVLLYGVCSVVLVLAFIGWWIMSIRSAYKAECLAKQNGKAPSFTDDVHELFDAKASLLLMFLPTLGIAVFTVLPLIFMISMAFTSYDHNHSTMFNWVGLKNFATVFSGSGTVNAKLFVSVLIWTLIWAFFATFLNFFGGLFMAMIINRKTTHWKGFWRACFSMSIAVPQFVSLLAISQMLKNQGIINTLLMKWGWIHEALPFFENATWARVTVIVVNLWIGIPYTIMQITGILQNIPADLYEAARIDGANWWQIFTKITMPYIIFVLTPYLITTFTGNVNNFNVIYLLTAGAPTEIGDSAGKTDLLITWLYKLTVDNGDFNLGAVIGILTFIVLAVVSLITYRNSGSYKNEEAFR